MSAEGKKKRGISGLANAKSISFRYGGSHCDYSEGRRPGTASHPRWAGSRLVQAFTLGAILNDRWTMQVSPIPITILAVHVEDAMMRCPIASTMKL